MPNPKSVVMSNPVQPDLRKLLNDSLKAIKSEKSFKASAQLTNFETAAINNHNLTEPELYAELKKFIKENKNSITKKFDACREKYLVESAKYFCSANNDAFENAAKFKVKIERLDVKTVPQTVKHYNDSKSFLEIVSILLSSKAISGQQRAGLQTLSEIIKDQITAFETENKFSLLLEELGTSIETDLKNYHETQTNARKNLQTEHSTSKQIISDIPKTVKTKIGGMKDEIENKLNLYNSLIRIAGEVAKEQKIDVAKLDTLKRQGEKLSRVKNFVSAFGDFKGSFREVLISIYKAFAYSKVYEENYKIKESKHTITDNKATVKGVLGEALTEQFENLLKALGEYNFVGDIHKNILSLDFNDITGAISALADIYNKSEFVRLVDLCVSVGQLIEKIRSDNPAIYKNFPQAKPVVPGNDPFPLLEQVKPLRDFETSLAGPLIQLQPQLSTPAKDLLKYAERLNISADDAKLLSLSADDTNKLNSVVNVVEKLKNAMTYMFDTFRDTNSINAPLKAIEKLYNTTQNRDAREKLAETYEREVNDIQKRYSGLSDKKTQDQLKQTTLMHAGFKTKHNSSSNNNNSTTAASKPVPKAALGNTVVTTVTPQVNTSAKPVTVQTPDVKADVPKISTGTVVSDSNNNNSNNINSSVTASAPKPAQVMEAMSASQATNQTESSSQAQKATETVTETVPVKSTQVEVSASSEVLVNSQNPNPNAGMLVYYMKETITKESDFLFQVKAYSKLIETFLEEAKKNVGKDGTDKFIQILVELKEHFDLPIFKENFLLAVLKQDLGITSADQINATNVEAVILCLPRIYANYLKEGQGIFIKMTNLYIESQGLNKENIAAYINKIEASLNTNKNKKHKSQIVKDFQEFLKRQSNSTVSTFNTVNEDAEVFKPLLQGTLVLAYQRATRLGLSNEEMFKKYKRQDPNDEVAKCITSLRDTVKIMVNEVNSTVMQLNPIKETNRSSVNNNTETNVISRNSHNNSKATSISTSNTTSSAAITVALKGSSPEKVQSPEPQALQTEVVSATVSVDAQKSQSANNDQVVKNAAQLNEPEEEISLFTEAWVEVFPPKYYDSINHTYHGKPIEGNKDWQAKLRDYQNPQKRAASFFGASWLYESKMPLPAKIAVGVLTSPYLLLKAISNTAALICEFPFVLAAKATADTKSLAGKAGNYAAEIGHGLLRPISSPLKSVKAGVVTGIKLGKWVHEKLGSGPLGKVLGGLAGGVAAMLLTAGSLLITGTVYTALLPFALPVALVKLALLTAQALPTLASGIGLAAQFVAQGLAQAMGSMGVSMAVDTVAAVLTNSILGAMIIGTLSAIKSAALWVRDGWDQAEVVELNRVSQPQSAPVPVPSNPEGDKLLADVANKQVNAEDANLSAAQSGASATVNAHGVSDAMRADLQAATQKDFAVTNANANTNTLSR